METPPRMRGRLTRSRSLKKAAGNTPAYAGKTSGRFLRGPTWQKHPRVCGEDSLAARRPRGNVETPPRMRGRPGRGLTDHNSYRNTPAYAGKTTLEDLYDEVDEKHPRVCGEDIIPAEMIRPAAETPPRMRGRQDHCGHG